ncbi:MAG: hypothetical protein NTY83_00100 [Candidatus Micrarchaeota archaeon]|nr:hypothetical protein [Candidatus Micrarchaeota archaeon]
MRKDFFSNGTNGNGDSPRQRRSTFLTSVFGDPAEKAAALLLQLPSEKAEEKLVKLGADAVSSLLTVLRNPSLQEKMSGGNEEVRNRIRGAAAEIMVRIGVPAIAQLRPLLSADEMDSKRLGHSLIRKILIRALENPNADAVTEKEVAEAGAEVLRMMAGAEGHEISMGMEFSSKIPGAETIPVLGMLAKEGWSKAQKDRRNARIAEMEEIRGRLASEVDIETRSLKGAVPEQDIVQLIVPGEPKDHVRMAERRLNGYRVADGVERGCARAEAVAALGRIGNADAVKELLGLLEGLAYEPGLLCSCSLDVKIAAALKAAAKKNPEATRLIAEAAGKWNSTEKTEIAKAGQVSDSLARERAAHMVDLLSGVF